jgi:hypothetical protein
VRRHLDSVLAVAATAVGDELEVELADDERSRVVVVDHRRFSSETRRNESREPRIAHRRPAREASCRRRDQAPVIDGLVLVSLLFTFRPMVRSRQWLRSRSKARGKMHGRRVLTETATEQTKLPELDPIAIEIYGWRIEQLLRAGYSDSLAQQLADSRDVDLHLACDLLARGCPEQIAYAILS